MSFWWKYYSLQASSSSIHILFDWRIYSVNYGGKWLSSMNPIHHSHAHIISLRWRICYIHCILEFPREITHVKYSIQISWMHETFPQKASRSRYRTNYYFTWFAHSLTVNYSRLSFSLARLHVVQNVGISAHPKDKYFLGTKTTSKESAEICENKKFSAHTLVLHNIHSTQSESLYLGKSCRNRDEYCSLANTLKSFYRLFSKRANLAWKKTKKKHTIREVEWAEKKQ